MSKNQQIANGSTVRLVRDYSSFFKLKTVVCLLHVIQPLAWDLLLIPMVGVAGVEPATLRLSSACSNQLSYEP